MTGDLAAKPDHCEDCGETTQVKLTKGAFTDWWLCQKCRAGFLGYLYHYYLVRLT